MGGCKQLFPPGHNHDHAGLRSKEKRVKWIYYYAIIRCLLLMLLTGKRGSFVIPLILYIFCKHFFIQKYKRRHFVLGAAGIVLFLALISFVAYGRGDYSNLNFIDFILEKISWYKRYRNLEVHLPQPFYHTGISCHTDF